MNIVAGVTSRPESRVALDRAIDEVKLRGGHLYIIHTMDQGLKSGAATARDWTSAVAAERATGERIVEELAEQGIEATYRVELANSGPAATLLEVAEEVGADLIVIGIRRRSAVGKLVLGSVSQAVLLGADCPVLAVKGAEDDAA